MTQPLDAESIQRLHYFRSLETRDAELAALALARVCFNDGEELFQQGDEGAWIYLLASGAVEICLDIDGRDTATLCTLQAPALLGEMSLLLDEPRTATAIARGRAEVWQVSRSDFNNAIQRGDIWANQLLLVMSKVLAARLADMNRKLVDLIKDGRKREAEQTVEAHQSPSNDNGNQVAELEQLRERLFAQWSF